ncbi:hypothetical protein [Rugosimonospora africana]
MSEKKPGDLAGISAGQAAEYAMSHILARRSLMLKWSGSVGRQRW